MATRWKQDLEVAQLIEHLNQPEKFENPFGLTTSEQRAILSELDRCRNDFIYAARNYFWISNKDSGDQLFSLWPSQELILEKILELRSKKVMQKLIIIKSRQLGAMDPETPVLKANLVWDTLGSLHVGDEVVSTDEFPPGGRGVDRKFRTGIVLNKWDVLKEAFRITLEDGRILIATADHIFLCKRRGGDEAIWRTVKKLGNKKTSAPIVPGDEIRVAVSQIWNTQFNYEDGWMGGLIDGEGCLRTRNQSGVELNVSQVAGAVLERAATYLSGNGYPFNADVDKRKSGTSSKLGNKPVLKLNVSQMSEVFRLLGTTRPERFRHARPWEGKSLPRDSHRTAQGESWLKVVSVEPLGVRRMVDIETSTKTFIANGVVTHNCSTLIEGLIAWRTMFFANTNALVVSYDRDHAAEVLFPMMLFIYDRMPWWMKPECSSRQGDKGLLFENRDPEARAYDPGLNSHIFVKGANAVTGVGQGLKLNCVHASEFADWPDKKAKEIISEDMVNALVDSPQTFAILESTAKGANRFAHHLWKKNVERGLEAEWFPVFLPWFFDHTHVRTLIHSWQPEPQEIRMRDRSREDWVRCDNQLCKQYHPRFIIKLDRTGEVCPTCETGILNTYELTDRQLYWMEHRRKNAETDDDSVRKLKQEMCLTAEEAFQVTGYQIFGTAAQEWAASTAKHPIFCGFFDGNGTVHGYITRKDDFSEWGDRIYTGGKKCIAEKCDVNHEYDDMPLEIYEWPDKSYTYCCGADLAEGLGGRSAYSVGSVIRYSLTGGADYQVAVWRSNTTEPITFGTNLFHLGTLYNEALMSVECNRYDICMGELRKLQYPNLYRWKHIDSLNVLTNKLGWWTNLSSRPRLWQTFKKWMQSQLFYVRSRNLVEEMKNFVKDEEDATMAGGDNEENDDELLATMIALYTAHEADWNDALQGIPVSNDLNESNAKLSVRCMRCGYEWWADTIADENAEGRCKPCPKCNALTIECRSNTKLSHEDAYINEQWAEATSHSPERALEKGLMDYSLL